MQAVIMAGGKGTRLTAITKNKIPKPLARIAGKPILEWQLEQLRCNDITEIIIAIGHLGEKIIEYFGNGDRFGVHIRYYCEEEPLGSAGCLYFVREMLGEGPFFLVFGDVLFNIDLDRMILFHIEKQAEATLFVHPNAHPFDSDLVIKNLDGRVTAFDSKLNDRSGYWYDNCVNAGLYLLNRRFCDRIFLPAKTDLEKDILFPMVERGESVYAYSSPEYVKDVGTPERIEIAAKDIELNIPVSRNLKNQQKAFFLDRDGTINVHKGLISCEEDFELYTGVAEAIRRLNLSGYLAIVITNQPVVARGLCDMETVENIHKKMKTLLGREHAFLDGIEVCPHHPDKGYPEENVPYKITCCCRKPDIGMVRTCVEQYNIDCSCSWMIGDTSVDIQTGKNARMKTALVLTGEAGKDGKYMVQSDIVCSDLLNAVTQILEDSNEL